MSSRPLLVWTSAVGLALAPQAAHAVCHIGAVRPNGPVPMNGIHEFTFQASVDCETLEFRVPGTPLSKTPRGGVSGGERPYKVVLSATEWHSVVGDNDTSFTWSIVGTTHEGRTTRVTTTNDLVVGDGGFFDLSRADAKLAGVGAMQSAGACVSSAGDVNADGHDDLLVGAWASDGAGGRDAGAAFLVLGPVTGTVGLGQAQAKLVGNASDYVGASVSGAGDVDGDGHDDVLVGAYGDPEGGWRAGAAFLLLGPMTGTFDTAAADGKLVGEETQDYAGIRVSGAGDVNGDGRDDLLVGASGYGPAGAAYVVSGPVTGTLDLSSATAKLVGEAPGNAAGSSVSGAGDMNGDGNADVLVSDPQNNEGGNEAGAVYLVFGPMTGVVDLSLADAKLVGEEPGDKLGFFQSISDAGDVDGDGHPDVVVGAYQRRGPGYLGAAYLVRGPISGTLDLSLADAKLTSEEKYDAACDSVSGAGDVDADGHDDLLVGARYGSDETGGGGLAYLVMGPVTGAVDLARADVRFVGEETFDWAGGSVSDAGDVDADGRADIIIGALGNELSGAAYVLYGAGL